MDKETTKNIYIKNIQHGDKKRKEEAEKKGKNVKEKTEKEI